MIPGSTSYLNYLMLSFSDLEISTDGMVSSQTFVMIKCANMCESLGTAFGHISASAKLASAASSLFSARFNLLPT